MFPLKLVRSLVLGETLHNHPLLLTHTHVGHDSESGSEATDTDETHVDPRNNGTGRGRKGCGRGKSGAGRGSRKKIPMLLFLPTGELISDTNRLAAIARELGMDLYPTPSLSHIVFSYPSPAAAAVGSSSLSWSTTSLSSSLWSLPGDAVPLPFPSIATSSPTLLRSFVALSKGLFKLVFAKSRCVTEEAVGGSGPGDWDCCSLSLFSRLTGERIGTMDGFSRALTGAGWTLFKSKKNPPLGSGVFLFRKVESNRVRLRRGVGDVGGAAGECRIRELKLPQLDFGNAPLRILQYILLMTDDVFYLA